MVEYERKRKKVQMNTRYKRVFLLGLLMLFVFVNYGRVSAGKRGIVEKNLILTYRESYQLNADLAEEECVWKSRNPQIVNVDAETGLVTAVAKGKTTIDLYLKGKKKGTCTVKVESPELNVSNAVLEITDTMQLKVKKTTQEITYESSDSSIASVTPEGLVKGVSAGSAKIAVVLTNPTTGRDTKYQCKVKVKKTKLIALTFDDGPSAYTPIVLDALEKYQAKATFFVLGSRVTDQTMKYVERANQLGCEIGNHTYSHKNLGKTPMNQVLSEVSKMDQKVQSILGGPTQIMRPPYGSLTTAAQKQIEKVQVLWSVDTLDWKYRNSDYVTKYVLNHASDGDIVLLHDIHKSTAKSVDAIIKGLMNKGYKLVTVSELAQAKGKELKAGEKYYNFK